MKERDSDCVTFYRMLLHLQSFTVRGALVLNSVFWGIKELS